VLTRHDAWNPEQWLYVEQSTLSRLEQSVLEIEQRFMAADQPLVSGGEGGPSEGDESFRIVCSESQGYQEFSVRIVLRRLTDYVGILERRKAVLSLPQQVQTLELARRIEALSARTQSSLESAGSSGAAA